MISRLVPVVPFFILILLHHYNIALIIFIVSALTEIDGFIARVKDMVSQKGAILDVVVDKISLIPIFILTVRHLLSVLVFLIALIVLIHILGALTIKVFDTKFQIQSNIFGKLERFFQVVGVIVLLLNLDIFLLLSLFG